MAVEPDRRCPKRWERHSLCGQHTTARWYMCQKWRVTQDSSGSIVTETRARWTTSRGGTRIHEFRPTVREWFSLCARESGGNEIWIYDAARGTRTRLSPSGPVSRPIWSADGKRINISAEQGTSIRSLPTTAARLSSPSNATINSEPTISFRSHGPEMVVFSPSAFQIP